MTPQTLRAYWRARAGQTMPASDALAIARHRTRDAWDWTGERATRTDGPVTLTLTTSLDDWQDHKGIVADHPIPGGIKVDRDDSGHRRRWSATPDIWYALGSGETLDDLRAWHRRSGMARHDAWLRARQTIIDAYWSDVRSTFHVVTVTASAGGEELARSSVGGVRVDDMADWRESRAWIEDTADDIAAEILTDARTMLAARLAA